VLRILYLLPLLGIALLLTGLFFAGRWANGKLATLSLSGRIMMLAALLCLGAVAPFETWSRWTIAVPFAPALFALSMLAYFLAIVAAWTLVESWPARWLGRACSVVLALPLLSIAFSVATNPMGVLLLILVAPALGQQTESSGRISPTLVYTVGTSHGLVGNTPFETYEIYRNPRWLPWIHKRVSNGPANCDSAHLTIGPGSNDDTVRMTCRLDKPWHGQSSLTTDVPLRQLRNHEPR
jgi:hypothetical protein